MPSFTQTTYQGPLVIEDNSTTGDSASLKINSGAAVTAFLAATATLDFGSTLTATSTDLTVTVTGAAVNDFVQVAPPAAPNANTCFTGWVSAANTVTVRFNNYSGGTVDPASGSYRVLVTKVA